ncbi:MAG: hypothetical protein COA78_35045 [Blastopirellula sp.]|nr:MAG: hypothetical protein COA78_35045 [Blastopirellula sp.]
MAKDNKPLRLDQIQRQVFDDQGENLFSEKKDEIVEAESVAVEGTSYEAQNFETTLGNHAFTVLFLGLLGLTALIGCGLFAYYREEDRIMFLILQPIFAMMAAIPAWLTGRNDMKAIQAGAMHRNRYGVLVLGTYLGAIISGLVFLLLLYYLLSLVFSILGIDPFSLL